MEQRTGTGRLRSVGAGLAVVPGLLLLLAAPADAQTASGDTLTFTRQALFSGLVNTIGLLPSPSGGGFTYSIDPALGVIARTTESFGPIFSERAETTGKGKFTLNATYTYHSFDEVDGVDLTSGALQGTIVGLFPPNTFRFNTFSLREDVNANVGTITGLYGVTDRIDVGITIPILKVSVKERARRTSTQDCPVNFAPDLGNCSPSVPRSDDFVPSESDAVGIGDIVLRGKYNFWNGTIGGGRAGLAVALDIRIPTGDEGNIEQSSVQLVDPTQEATPGNVTFPLGDPPLGIGIVRVKPQLIFSGSWGGFSPHVNLGAELGTTEGVTNDLVYNVGVDYTLFGRATLVADILGRYAFDVDRPKITPQGPSPTEKAGASTVSLSVGVKFNPIGTLLIFANVLIPLNDTGVRDNWTPTVGLEWSF